MTGIDFRGVAYLAALAVGAAIVYQVVRQGKAIGKAAGDVARQVVDSINPANPENVVNQAVTKGVQIVTGEKDATLGTKLAEWFNPDVRAADAAIAAPVVPRVYPGLDAELRAGAPQHWTETLTLSNGWEESLAAAARQSRIIEGPGGAAFGLYPGMR